MAIVGNQPIEEAPSVDDWNYKFIPIITDGIDKNLRSDSLADSELVVGENVRLDRGNLVTDLGIVKFGAATRGFPQKTYQFKRINGTTILTLITTLTFYSWDVTEAEWQYVSNGTSTTLSGNEASGQTVISVVSALGFAAGEFVGITLDNGKQH